MEMLCASVRDSSSVVLDDDLEAGFWGTPAQRPPSDIQLSLTVLGRLRDEEPSPEELNDITDRGIINLDSSFLRGVNLTRKHLEGATFRRADLRESNLSGGFFEGAVFYMATCARSNFAGSFPIASFDKANLANCDFSGAGLLMASFDEANIAGCCFDGADLRWAVFAGAKLGDECGASFQGAIANAETIWPDGFDPASHGVIIK